MERICRVSDVEPERLSDCVMTEGDQILWSHIRMKTFDATPTLIGADGRLQITSFATLACLCFLPIFVRYLQYILQTVAGDRDAVVLFLSRDGYFFQKAYAMLSEKMELPDSVYFYASRQVANGVMVQNEADIELFVNTILERKEESLRFQLEYFFEVPFPASFDIHVADALDHEGADSILQRVLQEKMRIFAVSAKRRARYQAYLSELHLERYEKSYCIDLVTKGTLFRCLRKILPIQVELIAMGGLPFLSEFVPDRNSAHLLFGMMTQSIPLSHWFSSLELPFASSDGQLRSFTADGQPVFAPNTEYDAELLDKTQEALMEAIRSLPVTFWKNQPVSNSFALSMLSLLGERFSRITQSILDAFRTTDPERETMQEAFMLQRNRMVEQAQYRAKQQTAWRTYQFLRGMEKNISPWQNQRMAVYGLGKNAERVLCDLSGFCFPVVVACDHIGTTFCERPVVALRDAIAKTDGLIIAATPKSTQEIFERIHAYVPQEYPVVDLLGRILNASEREASLSDLKQAIDAHDVISFDIFDTLVRRTTKTPQDVFDMAEQRIRAQGEDVPFAEWRKAAELDQVKLGHFPSFEEIYQQLQRKHHLSDETVERWKTLEWGIEEEVLVVREDVAEAFRYALEQGKCVCLTSDMYFTQEELQRLLEERGLTGWQKIFVSCEHQATKADGALFRFPLEFADGRLLLHIGDHPVSDDEMPQRLGIDTYLLWMPREEW